MHKYHAKKTEADGIMFDSKKEEHRYQELKLLLKAGEISDLQLQPEFTLQPKFKKKGTTYRAIHYIADFMYWDNRKQQRVIEDCKGMKTEVYKLKKKLFEYIFHEYTLTEV